MWQGSYEFTVSQWGVGHGGFHTQSMWFQPLKRPGAAAEPEGTMLRIIYDCGSKRGKKILLPAIKRMLYDVPSGSMIDLLVISHFDSDHVNGIRLLAAELDSRGIRVARVWTPLITKIEALLAISAPIPAGGSLADYAAFVYNPVGRIADLFPDAEITPIEPTDGPIPPPPDLVDPDNTPLDSDGGVRITKAPGGKGLIISPASTLPGEALWEIQPYTTASTIAAAKALNTELSQLAGKPVKDCTLGDLIKIVQDKNLLKRFRDSVKKHESTSRGRTGSNLSSICVYSGPVSPYDWCRYRKGWLPVATSPEAIPIAPSWLGTGDAALKHPGSVDAMRTAFTANRLDRVGLASAPHHAAQKDSGADLWDALPNLRRLTIEAKHKVGGHDHPHQDVLNELAPRNIVVHFCIADEDYDFHWTDKGIR